MRQYCKLEAVCVGSQVGIPTPNWPQVGLQCLKFEWIAGSVLCGAPIGQEKKMCYNPRCKATLYSTKLLKVSLK